MKLFPLANVSKLSGTPGEALRESLTHPFPVIVSGKSVENTSVSSNKNGVVEAIWVLCRLDFPNDDCLLFIIILFYLSWRKNCSILTPFGLLQISNRTLAASRI